MRIGIPRELKPREGRVGLIPAACVELVRGGHEVFIEHGAVIGHDKNSRSDPAPPLQASGDTSVVFGGVSRPAIYGSSPRDRLTSGTGGRPRLELADFCVAPCHWRGTRMSPVDLSGSKEFSSAPAASLGSLMAVRPRPDRRG